MGFPRTYIHLHTFFLWWTTFYEMHLLSFAKNLMLHAKISNIHILQGTLPTYLNIHTYFAKHFCHLSTSFERHFCYMFTFYSHIWSYTWEAASCYVRSHIFTFIWKKQFHVYTFIGKAIFVLLIHIFERQFHVIYSYFEKHFRAIFNIHAHSQSTWLPILYTHVHGAKYFHTI